MGKGICCVKAIRVKMTLQPPENFCHAHNIRVAFTLRYNYYICPKTVIT